MFGIDVLRSSHVVRAYRGDVTQLEWMPRNRCNAMNVRACTSLEQTQCVVELVRHDSAATLATVFWAGCRELER